MEYLFNCLSIRIGKTGFYGELWIHATVKYIYAAIDSVFHPHRVGATLGSITLAADALCNLGAGNVDGFNAESGLNSDRAAYADRDARVAFVVATVFLFLSRLLVAFQCK